MMKLLHRLSKDTLTAIVADLHNQRFPTRDEACEALDICRECINLGGTPIDQLVFPSPVKPGWMLLSPDEAKRFSSVTPEEEEKRQTVATQPQYLAKPPSTEAKPPTGQPERRGVSKQSYPQRPHSPSPEGKK